MRDPRLDTLAEMLVRHCTAVKRGDLVTIVAEPGAIPAVEATFEATLRAGGHPSFHPRSDALQELLLRHGSDNQLQHVCPFEKHRLSTCDVLIVLIYPTNTKFLGRIDPHRATIAQAARRPLLTMSLQRAAAGQVRYVLTEIPSNAAAQDADMSLTDYADWVYQAGFLHLPDPIAAWRTLHDQQQKVIEYLQSKHTLRFQAPACDGTHNQRPHDGTDLTVDVGGRTWVNCAGIGGQNFPDGEVFTGPRSVDGVVNFTFPAVYRGKEVEGVRLKFIAGRVVEASATKNQDYLFKLLDQDDGARNVGEIAIGTNYALKGFSKNAFFDEKIGGTFHLALGAGYPETGNSNESALHWDIVCDLRPSAAFPGNPGGTIHADGELFHHDGRFLFPGWPGTN
ncbi:MAG: aminopeptidase [Phycisphaerales bacterium]|nr:aminopeptidase [Phycisphaerales bacterium]